MIKNGDVIGFEGYTFGSYIIRLFTHSNVTHVGVALWVCGRLCVIEAKEGKGVRVFPLDRIDVPFKVYPIVQKNIDGQKVVDFCLTHWGAEYTNWYQFLIIGSRIIKYIRRKMGKSPDLNPIRWFCSELIARAFESAGYIDSKHSSLTTPIDICNYRCLGPGKR